MEKKLQDFLDKAFAPYGSFPARAEVTKELLANLAEKYADLKREGMSDDEAYKATVDSFGDVSEIMEQLPHAAGGIEKSEEAEQESESSVGKALRNAFKKAKASMGVSKFGGVNLQQADLSSTDLSGQNFSYSALTGADFSGSNLTGTSMNAAALKGALFERANLTNVTFAGSDLQDANFTGANLSGAKFKASALRGARFTGATLSGTNFQHSDLGDVSFVDQELSGVSFNNASLKNTSFKNATLHDVSFHHTDVKHTIFEGTKMDKVTYALLKGAKASVDSAVIVQG